MSRLRVGRTKNHGSIPDSENDCSYLPLTTYSIGTGVLPPGTRRLEREDDQSLPLRMCGAVPSNPHTLSWSAS